MMHMYTITYRGYEIDPVVEINEDGGWRDCSVEEATCFKIYPPDIDEPCLDAAPETLAEAKAAIDKDNTSTGEC